jgi:hypothetical protein
LIQDISGEDQEADFSCLWSLISELHIRSCLFELTATACHCCSLISTNGAVVGFGSLTASRKPFLVSRAAVRLNILESSHVCRNLALKLALYLKLFYCIAQRAFLIRRKVLRARPMIDLKRVSSVA